MWFTDITHFLDAEGNVPKQITARRLVQRLGAIVASVTTEPVQSSCTVDLKCRRRPGRKSCAETIRADFEAGTNNITWHCSSCGDSGLLDLSTTGSGRFGTKAADLSCPLSPA